MPFAIISKTGHGPALGIGTTEAQAWENAGLDAQERLNCQAVTITEESYQKALADPGPEDDQVGE